MQTYKDSLNPGFVDGNPVTNSVSKSFIADARVSLEIFLYFVHIQPPAIAIVKLLWQVPMVESDPGRDTPTQKRVNQPVVELYAFFIDGVISPAKWYDARPSNGEPVGACSVFVEQVKVLFKAMVVITCNVTAGVFCARRLEVTKSVPNAPTPAALVDCALDLVRGGSEAEFKVGR